MAKRRKSGYQKRYRSARRRGHDTRDARRLAQRSGVDLIGGFCYVATAVYGSYDCPQVWVLRRFRDERLQRNPLGRAFVKTYYAISPTLVRWFGKTNWFRTICKKVLDRFVSRLKSKGFSDAPYKDVAR